MKRIMNTPAVRAGQQAMRLQFAATNPSRAVLEHLHTALSGLTPEAVTESRTQYGPNTMERSSRPSLFHQLWSAFVNPFTAILFCLALVSTVTDMIFPRFSLFGSTPEEFDPITVIIILSMVTISGILRFVQERRSSNASEKLLAMITTTCTVTRDGAERQELPLEELVVGDIIHLSVGDLIPADVRILEARDCFVSQAGLTGESAPIEKTAAALPAYKSAAECENLALQGSSVVSGTATAVVLAVGGETQFGAIAASLSKEPTESSFTRGINAVSKVLIRFMLVMVPLVFVLTGLTKGNWLSAFLFAISVAVGLTPEMLPMIVTTCLAKGAVVMGRRQVIVKNLNAIQNFGAMDVLCTDKTGTLTRDEVVLEYHWNVEGREDLRVLRHAYLNSYFQTGYKNLMDLAIIRKTEESEAADPRLTDLSEAYEKMDEIPFDFQRRRLTTVVRDRQGKTQMVTKGAVEEMLSVCAYAECDGAVRPLDEELRRRILDTVASVNDKGFRVLALA